jgi:hypothetical protein
VDNEIVYKVVRNLGGVRVSSVQGPVVLAYRVGEPTTACAELPEAGPLAFTTYDLARKFAKEQARMSYLYGRDDHFEIYQAAASGVRPVSILSTGFDIEWRRKFWRQPDSFPGTLVFDAPRGTVVTSSLTLVRPLWNEENGDLFI